MNTTFYFDIIFVAFCIYTTRTLLFHFGLYKQLKQSKFAERNSKIGISIVVPARNEEENIANCINSIFRTTYDTNNFEVIAVNDRSNDKTGQILDDLAKTYNNLRVLHRDDLSSQGNLKGKAGALQYAIERANNEIILMTDADCIVNGKWIQTYATAFEDNNLGMAASFTLVQSNNLFSKLQAIEWLFASSMACGGIGINQPLGCYGNNVAVRKSVFDKIGGYNAITFSVTEDLALMNAVFRHGSKILYINSFNSTVTTLPVVTLIDFLKQHHRWAKGGQALGWRAVVFVISSFGIYLGMFSSLAIGNYPLFLYLLFFRMFCDLTIIVPSLIRFKKSNLIPLSLLGVIFNMGVEILAPFLLLKKNVTWKGQVFQRKG